ncbi:hypoxanthine-guanine phosphoribosyltransferase [mine drainage metagenome]|uniref:Hypoxanthine-guanine phosphoribosyltransferase n=1 Tax=mine drainage metagenome TaxID=410659 RepID=T1D2X5_9ZZZZ
MDEINQASLPLGSSLLYRPEDVCQALDEMARSVTERVGASRPLVLIVLTGGLYAGAWLTERLAFELEIDFVRVSRYRSGTASGCLEWLSKPRISPQGRTVLLVDDVWDEGVTLTALRQWLVEEGAERILSAVLIWKKTGAGSDQGEGPDIYGLNAGHQWLIGCGLDLNGHWRHLPAVYALSEVHLAHSGASI